MTQSFKTALTGFLLVSVIDHNGNTLKSLPPIRNLWLDQGLDRLATVLIPDAFSWCAKGLGQSTVKETIATSNTYSYSSGQITQTAGARTFTTADIGRLFHFSNGAELMVTGIISTTVATASPVGIQPVPANFTNKTANAYYVNLVGLDAESFQTSYIGTASVSKTDGNATVTASNTPFTAQSVGQCIYVQESTPGGSDFFLYEIASYIDSSHVTVTNSAGGFTSRPFVIYSSVPNDTNLTPLSRTDTYSNISGENGTADVTSGGSIGQRTLTRTFIFAPEPKSVFYNSTSDSSTFSWSSTTVTVASGPHTFATSEIGNYVTFPNGDFAVITARPTTTSLTVDRAPQTGPHTGDSMIELGSNQYDSFTFSDSMNPSPQNGNILVRLESGGVVTPVSVAGQNPEFPGQQLKVQYICLATVSPSAITARAAVPITDPGHVMSTNKFATSVVEAIALATIDSAGNTQSDFSSLEPSQTGALAISPSTAALGPMTSPDRTAGVVSVAMQADGYTAGQFAQVYDGTFQISDAIGTNWRSLGIFDVNANSFAFTVLFEANQAKTGNVTLNVQFQKIWNRNLS